MKERTTFEGEMEDLLGVSFPLNSATRSLVRATRVLPGIRKVSSRRGTAKRPIRLEVPSDLMKYHSAFPGGLEWKIVEDGVMVKKNGNEVIPRTSGQPISVAKVWRRFGSIINLWAVKYIVPCELIVPLILQESWGLDETSVRIEPLIFESKKKQIDYYKNLPVKLKDFLAKLSRQSYDGKKAISFTRSTIEKKEMSWNDVVSQLDELVGYEGIPRRISPGLIQTLVSTARSALQNDSINVSWLLNPINSLNAGIAYVSQQKKKTNYDPPKVTAAYNAGGIRESNKNPWKMVTYDPDRIDKYVEFFNDFVYVECKRPSLLENIFPSVYFFPMRS